MIDFEKLAAAMGDLDEDAVREQLEAVETAEEAGKALEACQANIIHQFF